MRKVFGILFVVAGIVLATWLVPGQAVDAAGTTQVVKNTIQAAPYAYTNWPVPCPDGTHLISGGYQLGSNEQAGEVFVIASFPGEGAWILGIQNNDSSEQTLAGYALCGS